MKKTLMQKYYDLTTLQKICLLIAIMSIFMGAVGATGYHFNSKSLNSVEIIYNNNLKPIRWVNLARVHINANRTNLYHAIAEIGHDSQAVKKFIDDIAVREKIIDENIDKVIKVMRELNDDYAVKELNLLLDDLKEYRKSRKEIIQYVLAGNKVESLNTANNYRDAAFSVIRDISEVASHIQKRAEKRYTKTEEDSHFAAIAIIVTIALAIIVSVSLGSFIAMNIQNLLNKLLTKMEKVAEGDLTVEKFGYISDSDVGKLCAKFDTMLQSNHDMVSKVCNSTEEIASGLEELNAAADQTAQGAEQVSTSVIQLASGSQEQANNVNKSLENINIINEAIQKILENAGKTVQLSEQTEVNANSGRNQSEEAVDKINQIKIIANEVSVSINELGKLSTEIEQIVDLIKGIASQTNLLALNAAIEAARAGEHGKGFAVVAEEVKKLAGESADATDKITEMIKEIQNKTNLAVVSMDQAVSEVDDGVHIVENTGQSLAEILEAAKTTSAQIAEISNEVEHLATSSDEVVRMMENISSITEESAASAEEISSISEEQTASFEEINASSSALAKEAENLQKQAGQFKI